MRFDKIHAQILIGELQSSASSGGSIMEKDDGMGNPITKRQFLHFINKLSAGLTGLSIDLEEMQAEIARLKKNK